MRQGAGGHRRSKGQSQRPQMSYAFLHIIVHNNEIYGIWLAYLRVNGIVPPSTAARLKQRTRRNRHHSCPARGLSTLTLSSQPICDTEQNAVASPATRRSVRAESARWPARPCGTWWRVTATRTQQAPDAQNGPGRGRVPTIFRVRCATPHPLEAFQSRFIFVTGSDGNR